MPEAVPGGSPGGAVAAWRLGGAVREAFARMAEVVLVAEVVLAVLAVLVAPSVHAAGPEAPGAPLPVVPASAPVDAVPAAAASAPAVPAVPAAPAAAAAVAGHSEAASAPRPLVPIAVLGRPASAPTGAADAASGASAETAAETAAGAATATAHGASSDAPPGAASSPALPVAPAAPASSGQTAAQPAAPVPTGAPRAPLPATKPPGKGTTKAATAAKPASAAATYPGRTPSSNAATSVNPAPASMGPALPYARAVMARYPDPRLQTDLPALQTGRTTPTTAQELNRWLADTALMAPPGTRVDHLVAGRSVMGEQIEYLRFSRGPGRPRVLLIGQQHGNEPAGAEALLVLARDLVGGDLANVLDRLDVLIVPRLNPDGAGWGSRVNGLGLDINRDHLALRSPEARALANLAREERPVLVIDCHEYHPSARALRRFGLLMRPDLMLQFATTPNLPEPISQLADLGFRQPIQSAETIAGFGTDWYAMPAGWPASEARMVMGGQSPSMARNAYGLRNAVSLLLESRGIGLGHWHLARRVQSHRVALQVALRQAAAMSRQLVTTQELADASVSRQACRANLVVRADRTVTRRRILMVHPDSGADQAVDVNWWSSLQLRPVVERPRPCGYWLAPEQKRAVQALQRLGIQVRRILVDVTLQAEGWTWDPAGEDPAQLAAAGAPLDMAGQNAGQPAGQAPGREDGSDVALLDDADTDRSDRDGPLRDERQRARQHPPQLQREVLPAPRGSYYVSMSQPLANLVAAALEPDAPGSFIEVGVIDRLDAVRRVLVAPDAPPR